MTQNQIAFHNAQELKRHNLAAETETARHQSAEEDLKRRSNELSHQTILESERHNKVTEAINSSYNKAAIASKNYEIASNYAVALANLAETKRANLAREAETERSNRANELIKQVQNTYTAQQLAETQRSNIASESLKAQQNAINAATLSETARHQSAMESIESRLASNTITKTQAEVSQISANTGYIQNKASETRAHTTVLNQQALVEAMRVANVQASTMNIKQDTTLKKYKTATEIGINANNWASAADHAVSAISTAAGAAAKIFGMGVVAK